MSWNFPYDSPNAITTLLEKEGLAMSRKFGQNFLISNSSRTRIVDLLDVQAGENVWEVGPGIGAITAILLERGALLTAFELDHGFCRILRTRAFGDEPGFTLIEGDALKTLFTALKERDAPRYLCGNLPYNVGSALVARLLEGDSRPERMVFTVQKEVAQRICAKEGSKDWSSFSLLAQADYDVEIGFDIPPGSFYPPPKVHSSVVVFQLRKASRIPKTDRFAFYLLVRELFGQRRKTLRNNLLQSKVGARIAKEGVDRLLLLSEIDPSRRPETLIWEDILSLSAHLSSIPAIHSEGTSPSR
ncbi:MAG: ribosomal RNA small subunit methyltransferase A [Spirochaetales bacterium]|jgi:16S rRNA (adenine1518-N6/adenine1519-N6)-dimethyltransferase|nr:ribosomal RNA small subunit methyltransferase A [Spirochaetales bacterium]